MPVTRVRDRGRSVPAPDELVMWRAFLRAHAVLTRRLEADLMVECGLPLPWYDVLLQLAEAPQRRLRMTELADRVLLSRSGLTRLVDRLQQDRLVRREPCPSDARGTFTVLTDGGLARLRAASPVHLNGIATAVTGRYSPVELATLGQLLSRLGTAPSEWPDSGAK